MTEYEKNNPIISTRLDIDTYNFYHELAVKRDEAVSECFRKALLEYRKNVEYIRESHRKRREV